MGKAKVIDIGLTDLKEVAVLVYMDRNEIDASYIKGIKKLTRFADATIASWLHISPRTMRSYKPEKVLDKGLGEQVIMLRAALEKGRIVLGSAEAFDDWLDAPNFYFDKKKPIQFLDTTSGIRYLFDRLTAMEYGDNV